MAKPLNKQAQPHNSGVAALEGNKGEGNCGEKGKANKGAKGKGNWSDAWQWGVL